MEAEKTRHCLRQTEGMILGYHTEMSNSSIGLRHIKAAEKELSELEAKATAYDNAKEDLELAQAVKAIFKLPLSYIVPSTYAASIGTEEELLKWYREQKESENE